MVSLSGFCDDGFSSGIGGSIIDKLGDEAVPSLNLQQIDSNKSEKRQASEPITSIQNRLEYFGSGSLGGFIKTQESMSEHDDQENINEERVDQEIKNR